MAGSAAYPSLTAGNKVSDGDSVRALISALTPGTVQAQGLPCLLGRLPGINDHHTAVGDLATTDTIPIATTGIWALSCVATDQNGNSAIARGQALYISSAAVISKDSTGTYFGVALGAVSSGSTAVIPVVLGSLPGTSSRSVQIVVPAILGKVGATAGFVVTGATDKSHATVPAGTAAATLKIAIPNLEVGDVITGYSLNGQIESAGQAVTIDADLRKNTAGTADNTDASCNASTGAQMAQLSVTADTLVSSANAAKTLTTPETVGVAETIYLLLTVTTGSSTDIDLLNVVFNITRA